MGIGSQIETAQSSQEGDAMKNTIDYAVKVAIPAAMSVLPKKMDAVNARAMILAIALQESRMAHRLQIGGPARGFCQFEQGGGVYGVLNHHSTKAIASDVCNLLAYKPTPAVVYEAIANNDTLAFAFARLLLWTLPASIPTIGQQAEAWRQYLSAWRPGIPHPKTWEWAFTTAHQYVREL